MTWLMLTLSIGVCAVGEWLSKRWASSGDYTLAGVAVLAYAIGSACWLLAIRQHNHLIVLWFVWAVGSAMLTLLIGSACGERLTGGQMFGVALGFAGLILLCS